MSTCLAFLSEKKKVYSKGKNLLPLGSKFFPSRVDCQIQNQIILADNVNLGRTARMQQIK